MTKSSCIQHPAQAPLVILREEYRQICEGNHCAAMLLSVFEYWHNIKLGNAEQAETDRDIALKMGVTPDQNGDLWVYKTQAQLKDDLLGLFGETKVLSASRLLVKLGFVSTRTNPRYQWDRTTQYLFSPVNVQSAITQKYVPASRKSKQSKARKHAIKEPNSKGAIPEITTESTSEKKEKSTFPVQNIPAVETPNGKNPVSVQGVPDPSAPISAEQRAQAAEMMKALVAKFDGNNHQRPYTDEELRQQAAIAQARYDERHPRKTP